MGFRACGFKVGAWGCSRAHEKLGFWDLELQGLGVWGVGTWA